MDKIVEEITDDVDKKVTIKEEDVKKKKKIILGLPGDNYSSKFMVSYTATLNYLWDTGKYDIVVSPGVSSFVSFARLKTLGGDVLKGVDQKPFDGMEFDIFLTIDSDIIFSPQNLIDLIEATEENPVVAGIYRMADLKHFSAVEKLDAIYFRENGTYPFITQERLDEWKSKNPDTKYMNVAYTGMGFFAITKDVLHSLTYPYFHSELQEIKGKDGRILRDLSSEDFNICKNIKNQGWDIYVMPDLRVGHEKKLVV